MQIWTAKQQNLKANQLQRTATQRTLEVGDSGCSRDQQYQQLLWVKFP